MTISVGVCAWDGQATADRDDLLKQADEALYQAKENGRIRVVMSIVRGNAAVPTE